MCASVAYIFNFSAIQQVSFLQKVMQCSCKPVLFGNGHASMIQVMGLLLLFAFSAPPT